LRSKDVCSDKSSLVLASRAEEAGEAPAETGRVIAQSATRAVAAGLVSVAVKRVRASGALLELARRAAVAGITEAADMLHSVPRSRVDAIGLGSKVLLGPACAAIVTVVGAVSALTSSAIISGEAVAESSSAIAESLIRALSKRV